MPADLAVLCPCPQEKAFLRDKRWFITWWCVSQIFKCATIDSSTSAYFIYQINVKAKNASELFTYIEEHQVIALAAFRIRNAYSQPRVSRHAR